MFAWISNTFMQRIAVMSFATNICMDEDNMSSSKLVSSGELYNVPEVCAKAASPQTWVGRPSHAARWDSITSVTRLVYFYVIT